MRSMFRNILAWLDRHFPEKVVITQASFLVLKEQIARIEETLKQKTDLEDRMRKAEFEINKFNVHMGFGGKVDASMKVFQR